MENYNKESEKNLLEVVKQKEAADKKLLTLEWVIGGLSLAVLLIPIFIGAYVPLEEWKKTVIVLSGFVPALVGFHFAIIIEQTAGYYECKHCKHKYVPSLNSIYFSMHMGRTRYMRCPKCNKKSWQKKVLRKD